jgi:excisionase family DNA binding protein
LINGSLKGGEASMEPEIMTIAQVSKYLQISEMTTYKLVNEGNIPAFKIGRNWRVKKDDLSEVIDKFKRGEHLIDY